MLLGNCSLAYRGKCAVYENLSEQDGIVVDIGDASADEAQWWAFLLTQGQAWCATMTFGDESLVSPWSM